MVLPSLETYFSPFETNRSVILHVYLGLLVTSFFTQTFPSFGDTTLLHTIHFSIQMIYSSKATAIVSHIYTSQSQSSTDQFLSLKLFYHSSISPDTKSSPQHTTKLTALHDLNGIDLHQS